jgi:phospholipid/cholesterol/gamma-HCH transport system substrate-binding protein
MENKSHALAAGTFVIAVTLLLSVLALWLTRDRTDYTLFELSSRESVSGLQPQAAVRYKGVSVGKVTQIGFDSQVPGNVLIRIAVNSEAPITASTFAVLGYQGVTGLAHVLLDDAGEPLPAMPVGPSGIRRLPLQTSPFGKLAEQGPEILAQVQQAAQRLNTLLSDENQANFSATLSHVAEATSQLTLVGKRLETTVTQRLDPALASVPALAGDARQALQALQQAGTNTAAAAADISATTQRLNAAGGPIDQIGKGSESLARVMDTFGATTMPRVHRATDDAARAARQLGRTVGGINDNPQSFLYGPDYLQPGPGEPGFAAPMAR